MGVSIDTRERDDAAIRAVEEAYDTAWSAGDASALAALFSADAVVVNPLGKVARGRTDIQRVLGEFLRGPARGSRHSSMVTAVQFVTENVAVVDGEARLERARCEAPQPSVVHRFTDVLVKQGGTWLIAQVRGYVFTTAIFE
jgi:uncharacterized protein (TIGR02246 family)